MKIHGSLLNEGPRQGIQSFRIKTKEEMTMKKLSFYLLCFALFIFVTACVTGSDPKKFNFKSSDHRLLYDLMVERCEAINARDGDRLKRVYAKEASEPEWLIENWFAEYNQYNITMNVVGINKITIVGIDAAGSYVLSFTGRRSSSSTVTVLYVKEDSDWKIESVIER